MWYTGRGQGIYHVVRTWPALKHNLQDGHRVRDYLNGHSNDDRDPDLSVETAETSIEKPGHPAARKHRCGNS